MKFSGTVRPLGVLLASVAIGVGVATGLLARDTSGSDLRAATASPTPVGEATEVTIGDPIELGPGTALLFSVGNESLVRLFRREDGSFADPEVLFDAHRLIRLVQGGQPAEQPASLMGIAASADGREIVLGVCVRGNCRTPGGTGEGTAVDGYRSTDGGLTWSKYFEVPNSDPRVVAIGPDGVLVAGDAYEATIQPSGDKPPLPLQGAYRVYGLDDGTIFFANSANILRADGSIYTTLPDGELPFDVHGTSEADVIVTWSGGAGRAGIQFARFQSPGTGPAALVWHYTSQVACCSVGPRFNDTLYFLMYSGPAAFDATTGILHDIDMPFDLPGFPDPVAVQHAPLPTANPTQPGEPIQTGGRP